MYKMIPETTELIDKIVTWWLTTCWLDIAYTWLIGIQFKRIIFWLNGWSLDNIVQTYPYQYEITSGNSLNSIQSEIRTETESGWGQCNFKSNSTRFRLNGILYDSI